jgi:hypothetical protein
MPRTSYSLSLLFPLVLLAGGGGCGGRERPVKVEGVLTLDGNPLSGATVTFVPAAEGRRPASGFTDASGTFHLTTYNTGDGALPGEYKITVLLGPEDPLLEGAQGTDLAGRKRLYGAAKSAQSKKRAAAKAASSPVPAIYRNSKMTPLKQVVPADGKVLVELQSSFRQR